MDSTRITRQTSTTLPLRGELTHDAPVPKALWRGAFTGPLQWALEGPGWGIVRPVADFVLLHIDTSGGRFNWYVFNLADVAIVAGVVGLLYESLMGDSAPKAP